MDHEFTVWFSKSFGLFYLIALSIIIVAYAFWPSNKKRFDEAAQRLAWWVAEGKVRWREDVTEGLENAPAAFMGMFRGENRGKALVKVADVERVGIEEAM